MKYYARKDLKYLDDMKKASPELFQAYVDWDSKVFKEGALSTKVKELIAVAVAHAIQCPYCIDIHARKAEGCGVSEAELAEAIHVASVMQGGATLVHSVLAMKALDEED